MEATITISELEELLCYITSSASIEEVSVDYYTTIKMIDGLKSCPSDKMHHKKFTEIITSYIESISDSPV